MIQAPVTFPQAIGIVSALVAFGTIVGFAVKLGRVLQRMDDRDASLSQMNVEIANLRTKNHELSSKMAGVQMLLKHPEP